jgi:hypothetical protein
VSSQSVLSRALVLTYAMAGAGALVAAVAFATFADWLVHRSGNDALLLLPVSNVRFWFIPFIAAGCAGVAHAKGRQSKALVASTALFVALCVASTIQWYRTGVRLGPHWTAAEVSAAMDDVRVSGFVLGALMLLGFAVFLFGIRDSLREDQASPGQAVQQ